MRKRIPYLIISLLLSIILWQYVDKPEPEVVVVKAKQQDFSLIQISLLEKMLDSLNECDQTVGLMMTVQDEYAYNLDLCTKDYTQCMDRLCGENWEACKEENGLITLDPIIIEAPPPAPIVVKKEERSKHAVTLLTGATLEERKTDSGYLISERIRPVIGLGYMYFVTDDIGVGIMGYTNKTLGLTLTMRF